MKHKPKSKHVCDKCGRLFSYEKLSDVIGPDQRPEPGKPEPSGECPRCGSFCYPLEKLK